MISQYLLSAGLDGGTQVRPFPSSAEIQADPRSQFMTFIATFALFGGSGAAVSMPNWFVLALPSLSPLSIFADELLSLRALNPTSQTNLDYCLNLNQ